MNNEELLLVYGGAKISGTLINALVRAFGLAFEIGKALGSSIRRKITKNVC